MDCKYAYKKPYTIIQTPQKRLEVLMYLKTHTWKETLETFKISIATLKRWKSIYKNDVSNLQRQTYSNTRRDIYYQELCTIRYYLYLEKEYKEKFPSVKEIQQQLFPNKHIATVYRLIKYVRNNKHLFPNFKLDRKPFI